MALFGKNWYGKLVQFIYGKDFYRIQAELLKNYSNKKILIAGIGSGELIHQLNNKNQYTIIEKNKHFFEKSKQLIGGRENLKILNVNFFDLNENKKSFDLVFFPFFLDLFNKNEVMIVLKKAQNLLNPQGKIMIIDFGLPQNLPQKIHLQFLYLLFRFSDKTKVKNHFLSYIDIQIIHTLKIAWFYNIISATYAQKTPIKIAKSWYLQPKMNRKTPKI